MGFLSDLTKNIPVMGQIIGGAENVVGTILQNRANRKLAEYEYSKNLEMWNKQNQYNTPSAQMQRFKDAGLNPNLIYGQGTPGNAVSLPKYQAPTVDYKHMIPDAVGMLGKYQDLTLGKAQIDNAKAQNDLIKANTTVSLLNAGHKDLELGLDKIYMPFNKQSEYEYKASLPDIQTLKNQLMTLQYNLGQKTLNTQIEQKKQTLLNTQLDYQKAQLDRDIKELNLKYMKWGSPAWQSGTNLIRLIVGR